MKPAQAPLRALWPRAAFSSAKAPYCSESAEDHCREEEQPEDHGRNEEASFQMYDEG